MTQVLRLISGPLCFPLKQKSPVATTTTTTTAAPAVMSCKNPKLAAKDMVEFLMKAPLPEDEAAEEEAQGGGVGDDDSCGFRRPPVLAIFAPAKTGELTSKLGLLGVCNVHLKPSVGGKPDKPQEEVRLLASPKFQGWIDERMRDAEAVMMKEQTECGGSSAPTSASASVHCVLILGDFNLGTIEPTPALGDCNVLPGAEIPACLGRMKHAFPGDAWDALLERCGYRALIPASETTSFGPPVAKESWPYDNALVRYSCPAGISLAKDALPAASASAHVCHGAGKDMIYDFGDIHAMPELHTSPIKSLIHDLGRRFQRLFYIMWSDHKPICVRL